MMTSIEITADLHFTEKYGRDLPSRFRKLNDEMQELNEAFEIYQSATDPADRKLKEKHLKDELGDVQTVLSHITATLCTSHEELLINSIVKSKVREVVPDYMKGELKERSSYFKTENF
ncbi:hypothetical protein SAMN05216357_11055 [Porphyromonadaceae bacterium KH3CP3RA]|nr:hypothetical protein SAMN05216357_11055 [Porphyromonadaceae bacterium KH3CP3RA]